MIVFEDDDDEIYITGMCTLQGIRQVVKDDDTSPLLCIMDSTSGYFYI